MGLASSYISIEFSQDLVQKYSRSKFRDQSLQATYQKLFPFDATQILHKICTPSRDAAFLNALRYRLSEKK